MNKVIALCVLIPGLLMVQARTDRASAQRTAPIEKLPSAQQVLERYVNSLGGREAILRHQSCTKRGTYENSAAPGKSFDVVQYVKSYKYLNKIITPKGEFIEGFDGRLAWQSSPGAAPEVSQGILESFRRNGDLYYATRILDYFSSYKVVGIEQYEGRSCYHIVGMTKWGKENEHFFDIQTGLLAGYRFQQDATPGGVRTIEAFSEYKRFGGILVPTRTTLWQGEHRATYNFDRISFDDVDDSIFARPSSITDR